MSAAPDDLKRLHAVGTEPAFDRAAAVARARELLAPALRDREAPPYPVEALGPLAPACAAIADHGQVDPAMAGQSLLGAVSLLSQGLHNARTLEGTKPLSLYLATLGLSGDGKTTAESVALEPVWRWQHKANAGYQAALEQAQAERARRKKGDPLPEEPRAPHRLCLDATVEGLRRDLAGGAASQGVFTSEAAALVSGYGMSPEHRQKTAAVFCGLWDRGLLSVSRATGGRTERHGVRLAMHLMIQPAAAAEAMGDAILAAQGFWPRFLLAWPSPSQPRRARPINWPSVPAVGAYWRRCAELLDEPLGEDATDAPTIELQPAALRLLSAAFERFEREAKTRGGRLREVRPFALRATELACRVAAVLAAFDGRHEVSDGDATGALELVIYSVETWRAVIDGGEADRTGADALRLYEWITERPGWRASLRDILNAGPACTRSRDKRDAALDVLAGFGLVEIAERQALALQPEAAP